MPGKKTDFLRSDFLPRREFKWRQMVYLICTLKTFDHPKEEAAVLLKEEGVWHSRAGLWLFVQTLFC